VSLENELDALKKKKETQEMKEQEDKAISLAPMQRLSIKHLNTELAVELSDATRQIAVLGSDNSRLGQELASLKDKIAKDMKAKVEGKDEMSVGLNDVKAKNGSLYQRYLALRKQVKISSEKETEKDRHIFILSEHIQKLLAAVKSESASKKESELRCAEAEQNLKLAEMKIVSISKGFKKSDKQSNDIMKQDQVLRGQLKIMDDKYSKLHQAHHYLLIAANQRDKTASKEREEISNWIWKMDRKLSDCAVSKTNLLMGALKVYESMMGDLPCNVFDFQECSLGDIGVKALATTIQAVETRIYSKESAVKEQTRIAAIEKKYPNPPNMKKKAAILNLSFNGITDNGIKHLCTALAKSSEFTEIDLRGNKITKKGAEYIIDTLIYNSNIQAIDVSGNNFTMHDMCEYADQKQQRCFLSDKQDSNDESCLNALPVLIAKVRGTDSRFKHTRRRRSSSAPPRVSASEEDPTMPTKASFLSNYPLSCFETNRDMFMHPEHGFRLYPPVMTPRNALAKLTVDSISWKEAHNPSRRVQPRPESASISRYGGQEIPAVAVAMAHKVTIGTPCNPSGATLSGKVTYGPSQLKKRLKTRPNSAVVEKQTSLINKSKRQEPSIKAQPTFQYASTSLLIAFGMSRKGNVTGLGKLRRQDPEFHPDMRQPQTGETLIMHAARSKHPDVVKMLLDAGADIDAISHEGWGALHHAVDVGDRCMFDYLISNGINVNIGSGDHDGSALHLATRLKRTAIFCALLEDSKVDLLSVDSKGRTPMHIAVLSGQVELVRILKRFIKENPMSKDNKGQTPADYAVQFNHLTIQEVLLVP